MGVPRASYPMVIIYIIFVYYQIPDRTQTNLLKYPIQRLNAIRFVIEEKEIAKKEIVANIKIDSTKNESKTKNQTRSKPQSKRSLRSEYQKSFQKSQNVTNRAVSI